MKPSEHALEHVYSIRVLNICSLTLIMHILKHNYGNEIDRERERERERERGGEREREKVANVRQSRGIFQVFSPPCLKLCRERERERERERM